MAPSCWLSRTPFEKGLLLVLIVAVPYCIVILAAYLALLATKCGFMCDLTYGYAKPECEIPPTPGKSTYPFIGAVLYVANGNDRYLEPGIFISLQWLLTSAEPILYNNLTAKEMKIRAISDYWSMDGVVYQVQRIEFNAKKTLAALFFDQDVIDSSILDITDQLLVPNVEVERYFWQHNNSGPLKYRRWFIQIESSIEKVEEDSQGLFIKKPAEIIYAPGGIQQCIHYSGFPALINKTLTAINIRTVCDLSERISKYYLEDILQNLAWIESLINNECGTIPTTGGPAATTTVGTTLIPTEPPIEVNPEEKPIVASHVTVNPYT